MTMTEAEPVTTGGGGAAAPPPPPVRTRNYGVDMVNCGTVTDPPRELVA